MELVRVSSVYERQEKRNQRGHSLLVAAAERAPLEKRSEASG